MSALKTVKKKRSAASPWRTSAHYQSHLRPRQVEKPAPCGTSCPVATDARGAMSLVAQHDRLGLDEEQALDQAWHILTVTNPFPAIIGRICPHPCEDHCNRREKDAPVAVGAFERFIGDWGIARGLPYRRIAGQQPTSRSIAVVGAGPSGLACAYQLARRGHAVTVFEALPRPGGMLRYGVPPHRLSRTVLDAEINKLAQLDIVFRCDTRVGNGLALDELRASFDAVFVGIGAHRGRRLEIPGDQGADVMLGIDFLQRANSATPLSIGPRVVVVGDGQTAVDVALVANRRCKAAKTNGASVLLVRAHPEEEGSQEELVQEGIEVVYEATPTAIDRDARGKVRRVQLNRARLGEPDQSGLRLPTPISDTAFFVDADNVIAAVSQYPDWDGLGAFGHGSPWLRVDDWGRTPLDRVWSGGDDVTLGIAAASIQQGLRAALSIDAHLRGQEPLWPEKRQPVSTGRVKLSLYEPRPRSSSHLLTVEERLHNLSAETDQGITRQQSCYEAGRCLSCGVCSGCERCWMYCTPGCFSRNNPPVHGQPCFSVSLTICDGCRKCADECPSGFIEMC